MDKSGKYVLMNKDYEVLSFLVTRGEKDSVSVLEKLEHFDKAPYGMNEDSTQEELSRVLFKLLYSKTIAINRSDYEKILEATNSKDNFDLTFKGHGLSLSDHFWFKKENENIKYKDINFFENKWDDSFARAVLNYDYEALKNADLNVPDITTRGWAVKGWLCEQDGPKLYKLGIDSDNIEEALGEVLASRLAKRLFSEGEYLPYELKEINGQYASVSKAMLGIDEELVPLSNFLPFSLYRLFHSEEHSKIKEKQFFEKLLELGYKDLYLFFTKITCLRNLSFVNDFHFDNISMIRNLKTGQMRIAPIYDLGGAFGGSRTGRNFLSNINKASYMIIYFVYGNFDPDLDYSWYNPERLDGFEDEIREVLSKSNFYTPQLIENIIEVFKYQKSSLDEIAKNKKK